MTERPDLSTFFDKSQLFPIHYHPCPTCSCRCSNIKGSGSIERARRIVRERQGLAEGEERPSVPSRTRVPEDHVNRAPQDGSWDHLRVETTKTCDCGKSFTKRMHSWETPFLLCSPECAEAAALAMMGEKPPKAPVDDPAVAGLADYRPEGLPGRGSSRSGKPKPAMDMSKIARRGATAPGTCGRDVYNIKAGVYEPCAQKRYHRDQCRSQAQIDARTAAQRARRRSS
jgi:hypothetical protein